MASSLPTDTANWNIDDDLNQVKRPIHSQFPMSMSSFGGGDAPLLTNMPRVRNQLFTISTRSILATQTQLSVKYPSHPSTQQISSDPPLSIDSDSDIEDDVKPMNTDKFSVLHRSATPSLYCSTPRNDLQKEILKRSENCIHGSFEDLCVPRDCNSVGKSIISQRKRSPPALANSRSRMISASNSLLSEENRNHLDAIQRLKRKLIASQIGLAFTMNAIKHRENIFERIEALLEEKTTACAARLILHTLLLNSWRNTKRELDMRLEENAELKKSVENLTLQRQVLRHVQNSERQKSQEKDALIRSLANEVEIIKEDKETMRKEVEKMENQLNDLQASTENLLDENKILQGELNHLSERKDNLAHTLDSERLRLDQFSQQNAMLKENLKTLEDELKNANEQKSHWQETALLTQSEVRGLQSHVQIRENSIKELKTASEALRADKMKLIDAKSQYKTALDQTTISLQLLSDKNDEIKAKYERMRKERDAKAEYIRKLEMELDSAKKEFYETEKELLSFKLQNVRKRREWGNALYFLVSPMNAMRRRIA